jgi:hypothetical protein
MREKVRKMYEDYVEEVQRKLEEKAKRDAKK